MAVLSLLLILTTTATAKLECDSGVVEVDHWCPALDSSTGKCPLVKRNNRGVISDVVASYPHGRTCSWPCGAPASVNLKPLFHEEFKKLSDVGKTTHESLTGARKRAWLQCRSLCENDASCAAYTLDFKFFRCTVSTQEKPCGDFKYSCHTPDNGGTWWETNAKCGVNAALHKYTVKPCRKVDHSKSCLAPSSTTAAVTTTQAPKTTPPTGSDSRPQSQACMGDTTCSNILMSLQNGGDSKACLRNALCSQIFVCSNPCMAYAATCVNDNDCDAAMPDFFSGKSSPTQDESLKCMANELCKKFMQCFSGSGPGSGPTRTVAPTSTAKVPTTPTTKAVINPDCSDENGYVHNFLFDFFHEYE